MTNRGGGLRKVGSGFFSCITLLLRTQQLIRVMVAKQGTMPSPQRDRGDQQPYLL